MSSNPSQAQVPKRKQKRPPNIVHQHQASGSSKDAPVMPLPERKKSAEVAGEQEVIDLTLSQGDPQSTPPKHMKPAKDAVEPEIIDLTHDDPEADLITELIEAVRDLPPHFEWNPISQNQQNAKRVVKTLLVEAYTHLNNHPTRGQAEAVRSLGRQMFGIRDWEAAACHNVHRLDDEDGALIGESSEGLG